MSSKVTVLALLRCGNRLLDNNIEHHSRREAQQCLLGNVRNISADQKDRCRSQQCAQKGYCESEKYISVHLYRFFYKREDRTIFFIRNEILQRLLFCMMLFCLSGVRLNDKPYLHIARLTQIYRYHKEWIAV